MPQNGLCRPLEWDSRFFGYPVASLTLGKSQDISVDIGVALDEARSSGIRLLYIFVPPVDGRTRAKLMAAGAKPVGRKVEYAKKPVATPFPEGIALCFQNTPQLEALAIQSGLYSRFRMDSGFVNGEYERLYREWLAGSVRGDGGNILYVAGSPESPHGLVTLEPGAHVRIGLIAVNAEWRGCGVGRQLVLAAEHWCSEHKSPELCVATQAENRAACRFYERCGFTKRSETDIFHAWFS